MKKTINLFRSLMNDNCYLNSLNLHDISIDCRKNGVVVPLIFESGYSSNTKVLSKNNKTNLINLSNDDIVISYRIEEDTVNKLVDFYNGGNDKVFGNNLNLGFGIQWFCKKSDIRSGKKLELINGSYQVEIVIDRNTINEAIEVSLICFNNNQIDYPIKINQGHIIETLISETFVFEGNGSIFPVVEEPFGPNESTLLWKVQIDFEDIFEDSFDPSRFAIIINILHRNYIDYFSDKKLNKLMMTEIVSAALILLFSRIDENDMRRVKEGDYGTEGSIAHALWFFIETFGDSTRLDVLSDRIRGRLDQML